MVRHFAFKKSIGVPQQGPDMRTFLQLETLTLQFSGHSCQPINSCQSVNSIDLKLSCVPSLRTLHIENWSPKSISVAASCRVHAVWQQPELPLTRWWLLSPCWKDPGTRLTHLHFQDKHECILHSDTKQIHAIHDIIACQDGLETLKIEATVWGSEAGPFIFPSFNKGLGSALRVEIGTIKGCWLLLDELTPFNNNVVLTIEGPLHVGVVAASGSLQWYGLEGHFASNCWGSSSSLHSKLAKAIAYAKDKESTSLKMLWQIRPLFMPVVHVGLPSCAPGSVTVALSVLWPLVSCECNTCR